MQVKKFLVPLFIILLFPFSVCSASWDIAIKKDEMSGLKQAYATSQSVSSTERMSFPYSEVRAWLGVGCSSKKMWAYIGFNQSPNISHSEPHNGYRLIDTKVKWDNNIEYAELSQESGGKYLRFSESLPIIKNIEKSNTLLVEVNWFGNGKTYFKFPLKGSANAIKRMVEICDFQQLNEPLVSDEDTNVKLEVEQYVKDYKQLILDKLSSINDQYTDSLYCKVKMRLIHTGNSSIVASIDTLGDTRYCSRIRMASAMVGDFPSPSNLAVKEKLREVTLLFSQ